MRWPISSRSTLFAQSVVLNGLNVADRISVLAQSQLGEISQILVPEGFLCSLCAISLSTFVLIDFSLTIKAATLLFISGRGSAIPSA